MFFYGEALDMDLERGEKWEKGESGGYRGMQSKENECRGGHDMGEFSFSDSKGDEAKSDII